MTCQHPVSLLSPAQHPQHEREPQASSEAAASSGTAQITRTGDVNVYAPGHYVPQPDEMALTSLDQ
jgi:hypothetical protein